MDDGYRIALAFSNVQGLYSVSPLIAGVVASENDFVELTTRNLPRKSTLIRRKNSLAGFQETFNDVSEYLTCHLVLPVKGRFDLPLFEDTCIKAINILRSSHLFVIAGHIKSIVIKAPSKYDITSKSWKTMPLSGGFITKIRDVTPNYEIREKATKSTRLLEVAKILARLEFERQRSYNGEYVTKKVERNPLAFNQLIRLSWNSPSVDEYANELVGPPALIYRDPQESRIQLKAFPIGSKIDVIPLAKFCKGRQIDHDTIPCVSSTTKNPFGQHLIGSSTEQCTQCSEHFDNSICLYRKPLCNGFQVKCGNPEFAGHICCGLFGLYVTRFGTELKVGTAVLSNVVGRLLDQGAGFATVAYPLEGIMTAYELEGAVRDHLVANLETFRRFGITGVFRKAPPKDEKLMDFMSNWGRDDHLLMERVVTSLKRMRLSVEGETIDMAEAEYRTLNFVKNHARPPRRSYELAEPNEDLPTVKGKVVGFRGSLAFLDTGQVVDFKDLQGYVVQGRF